MKLTFYFFIVTVFLIGCDYKSETDADIVVVKIGEEVFNIPSKYILSSLPTSLVSNSALDKSDGISLKIPYADLGIIDTNEGVLESNLVVLLSSLSEYLLEIGVSPDASNAWNGVELYSDRIIKKDERTNYYRVGSEAAFPMFWHYFTASPEMGGDVKNYWIASCYEANSGKPTCTKQMVFNYTQSKLTISGKNILLLDRIEVSYRNLLATWER